MPADFERCVENGGKVRTKTLSGNKYMHICVLDGKTYAGEVKTKVGKKGSKKNTAVKEK